MTELRRITTTPVEWASFDTGKVLAVGSGKVRGDGSHNNESLEVLVFSTSGVTLSRAQLPERLHSDVKVSANSRDVVSCCASQGSERGDVMTLVFLAGSHLLRVQEVQCVKNGKELEAGQHSIVCIHIGECDVSVFAFGGKELFGCARSGKHSESQLLFDFSDACIVRVVRGRFPREVVVLLDNGSVALVELSQSPDGAVGCTLSHRFEVSASAVPTHAVFAGGSVLWIMCSDNSLRGIWFFPQVTDSATVEGEPVQPEVPVPFVSEKLVVPVNSDDTFRVFIAGEERTCGVHIAVQTPSSVNFSSLAMHNTCGPWRPPTPQGWLHSVFSWSGYIHDFSFKQRAYELLVQSERRGAPLNIISLRQNASVLVFEDLQDRQLCHQVVCAPPPSLNELRREFESQVKELESFAATVSDLQSTKKAMDKLLELQHCLVATLHRERELNRGLLPYQSVSMHLIRRLYTIYVHLSVYRFIFLSGVGERLDTPIFEALGLRDARRVALESQEEVRSEFQKEFGLFDSAAPLETLRVWGSRNTAPSMCIDAILASIGCTDSASLRSIIQQVVSIKPHSALLVLYCTFREAGCYADAEKHSLRTEFLNSFCLPTSIDMWAYVAYAADHHICPSTQINVAGSPPLLDILPALINGLVYSGAYEIAFHFTGAFLALNSASVTDAVVAVKLLYLAYKRGCAAAVVGLFRASRGTSWRHIATHVVACAASQTANVKLLSGLIAPQSQEEEIVESVFSQCSETCTRDVVLLDFYILMQRYADALMVCEQIASRHSVDAQRLQIIASHLRSLLPNGNVNYRLRYSVEKCEVAQNVFVEHHGGPLALTCPLVTPGVCPLENEEQQLEVDVARAAARINSWHHEEKPFDAMGRSYSRETNIVPFVPTPAAALGITRGKVGSRGHQHSKQNGERSASPLPDNRDIGNGSTPGGSLCTQVLCNHSANDTASMAALPVVFSAGREPLYCEVVLRRSKKQCGRERPCEYHDRVKK
ncbi:hypothetical protein ERJ75_001647300 [Trypanosoma vivax]|uniref:Uncharacterized protein n=1 Tax=Trypanosoma vivax (strain Y486) TaxID=1055687 RepID=G0U9B3_TRYVY|nr:hypothetical protein TRVL_01398 [Trypanosoma vivax]KAH8604935.1 hypothetical protein ERJ75_001647300 [Trypanosoma vivax]CCC54198.1 conserved hypothetical protein [Trypanosoma vivax Y486]